MENNCTTPSSIARAFRKNSVLLAQWLLDLGKSRTNHVSGVSNYFSVLQSEITNSTLNSNLFLSQSPHYQEKTPPAMNVFLPFKDGTHRVRVPRNHPPTERRDRFLNKIWPDFQPIAGLLSLFNGRQWTQRLSMSLLLMLMWAVPSAWAQGTVDLSVDKSIDKKNPAIGEVVTYVVKVKNSGASAASGVVITDQFPSGATYVSHQILRPSSAPASGYNSGNGIWNVGAVAANDSAMLEIKARVNSVGVWFNKAYVSAQTEADEDSTPGNDALGEDDYATVCFSVPIPLYSDEEFTVTIPTGYTNVVWKKGTTTITSANATSLGAVLNADGSLTIQTPGEYTFTVDVAQCPASGCCAIIVVPGQFGSIGNFVWQDTNADGGQTAGEPGINGVKVILWSVDASGNPLAKLDSVLTQNDPITGNPGWYTFDSLLTAKYVVQVIKPAGSNFSGNDLGGDDTKDSDVSTTTGISQVIDINVDLPAGDIGRNNSTIDAGIVPAKGSIGDFVWQDNNSDGGQTAGEPGINGVKVILWSADASGNPIAKLDSVLTQNDPVTGNAGWYTFSNLNSGDYVVQVVKPAGTNFTSQNTGDDTKDSDVNSTTGISQLVTINTSLASGDIGRNNPTIDAGIVPVKGSIGDYVFTDNDNSGTQTAGDAPVAGIKVILYKETAPGVFTKVDSTTTTATGFYTFGNLDNGNYKVQVVAPGREFVAPNTGTDDTKDSDFGSNGMSQVISINSGASQDTLRNNPNVDAGLKPQVGSIGDFVWQDNNSDGGQTAGEPGINGVKVILWSADASGNPIAKLDSVLTQNDPVTGNAGWYTFSNLNSGDYVVQVVKPAGTNFTSQNTGDDTKDSDVNSTTGISQLVTINTSLASGDIGRNNPTIDAGIVPVKGSIGDYVFTDNDNSGTQTAGDAPVAGIKVILYKETAPGVFTKVDSTTTTATGFYTFGNLDNGNYKVQVVAPGREFVAPNTGTDDTKDSDFGSNGMSQVISINSGASQDTLRNNSNVDAGLKPLLGSIGDYVWQDTNGDGGQTAGEPAIAGVKVILYKETAPGVFTKTDSTTTNGSGLYSFTNLTSGSYKVQFVTPAGFDPTKGNQGSDDTKDSDAGTGGFSHIITLNAGSTTDTLRNNPQIDAGFVPSYGSIGDYVFNDVNGDGIQNDGNAGVAGVKVILYAADGVTKLDSTVTDANGKYLFDSLVTGGYKVKFVTPAGLNITTKNAPGSTGANDSDAGSDGFSGTININTSLPKGDPGRDNKDVDAGVITQFGSIGNYVWSDTNENGQQDSGEPVVAGVKVILYSGDGITKLDSTITDANGFYAFDSLTSGSYRVKFVLGAGQQFTSANSGNDATDSDAGTDGFSQTVLINTSLPKGNIGRDNSTIDAGIKPICVKPDLFAVADQRICEGDELTAFGVTEPTDPINISVKWYSFTNSKTTVGASVVATTGGFTPTAAQLPPADGNTYYYAVIGTRNIANCSDTAWVALTINPKPAKPGVTPSVEPICVGTSSSLVATSTGNKVRWYNVATGGTVLAELNSGASYTVSPATTTTYYVEAVTAAGCISERVAVSVEVAPKPTTPTCVKDVVNACPAISANLSAAIANCQPSTTGGTFELRTGNTPTSALVSNPSEAAAGTYYLFEKSAAGCYSDPATITVNIIGCGCQLATDIKVTAPTKSCSNEKIRIAGTATGFSSYTWSTTGTGAFDNANELNTFYTPSALDIAAGTVTLTVLTNDPDGNGPCLPKRASVTIQVNPIPQKAFNVACNCKDLCAGDKAKLLGASSDGSTINWYDAPTGGNLLGSAPSGGSLEVVITKTTTYYAESSTGDCVNPVRTPVTVEVTNCVADLAVVKEVLTPGPYTPGQQITYAITATNFGPKSAKSVTVADVFPSSLTFVNASPSGQYNASTKIWTIGDLNATSSRTLTMVATINSGTSITNTAIVSSPDNDPTKTKNDTSSVTIDATQFVDLSIKKRVSSTNVSVGDVITYTLEVANGGPSKATGIEVRDLLPTGIQFVSSNDLVLSTDGRELIGTVASLDANAFARFTFKAKVTGEGTITNRAQITKQNEKDRDSVPGNGYTNSEDDDDFVDIIATKVCNLTAPTLTASTNTVCEGASAVLTASGCTGGMVEWSNGQMGASITVSPGATTSYTAVCKLNGCVSPASQASTVTVTKATAPSISASSSDFCAGNPVTISATGCNGTVLWSNGTTGATITVSPTASTAYTATCKVGECVSVASNTITLTPGTVPAPVLTCEKSVACPGECVTLTALNCTGTVVWNTGAIGSTLRVCPTATTAYSAKCKLGNCESPASLPHTITVTTPEIPTLSAANSQICRGQSTTLKATGCFGTVLWSNGMTGASITVSPVTTTSYTAQCSNGTCNSVDATPIRVVVDEPFAPIITCGATTVCKGANVTFSASGCEGGTIVWSNGMTGNSITVTITATTNFTAQCKKGECISANSNSMLVTVGTITSPTITANTNTVCSGGSVTLTAQGCSGGVVWSNGMTGNVINAPVTATTTFTANCVATEACKSDPSNAVIVTVGAGSAAPTISSNKAAICLGESVTLVANGCTGAVTWSNGATGSSISVSPTATTDYSATCSAGGCTSPRSNVVNVTINQATVPMITASNDASCGSPVTLTASNCAGTVTWSNGQIGASITVTPTATTTYSATCKVGECTSAPATKTITSSKTPTPFIIGSSTATCGGAVTLSVAECAGTVKWSTGETTRSITVTPKVTTTYTAVCTVNNCPSDEGKITITTGVVPHAPEIICTKMTICKGQSITFEAKGCAGTVQWSNGMTGSTMTISPAVTTGYTATCKVGDCVSPVSEVHTAIVIEINAPKVTASKAEITSGESVTLTASGCFGEVIWSNGQMGASITVTPASTTEYTAKCTKGDCISTVSTPVKITVNAAGCTKPNAPSISASKPEITAGESVTLTATGCSGTVVWSNGQTGTSISVSPMASTSYTAACQVGTCLSNNAGAVNVKVNPASCTKPEAPSIGSSFTSITAGATVTLTASNCSGVVMWSNGAMGMVFCTAPSVTTTYTAVCKVGECISDASNPITVTVTPGSGTSTCDPIVAPMIASNKTGISAGESATLTATGCTGTVLWSNGMSGATINVSPSVSTTYTAVCNVGNCLSSNSNIITISISTGDACATAAVISKPSIAVTKATIVTGESTTLTASNCNYQLKWSNGATTSAITVSPSVTTTYTAACFNPACPNAAEQQESATITVTAVQIPDPSVSYIGIAKATGTIVEVSQNVFEVPYTFTVKNYGSAGLRKVQVSDDLAATFGNGAALVSTTVTADAGFTVNTNFTGTGANTGLLVDTLSSLAAGETKTITLKVKVDVANATTRIFNNGAVATALTADATSKPVEDSSTPGTNPDTDGDGNPTNNGGTTACDLSPSGPKLLIALAITDTVRQGNGSWNITYKATAKNAGTELLSDIALKDSLSKAYPGLTFTVIGKPVATGTLKADTTFDGVTKVNILDSTSTLAVGATETVTFTINVAIPDSLKGPFSSSINGSGTAPNGTVVTDLSNSGLVPVANDDRSTPLVFGLPNTRIGVAKALLGSPIQVSDKLYEVAYEIAITNYGGTDITKLSVKDDLGATFISKGVSIVGKPILTADPGLTVDTTFNGQGMNTSLLVDSLSTLPKGETRKVTLTLRVDLSAASDSVFNNTAIAKGTATDNSTSEDASTSGNNADPDNNLNPSDNNVPTPVTINAIVPRALLGLAMTADTARRANGSYDITYTIVVRNYGNTDFTKVALTDTLANVFNNGSAFTVTSQPTVNAGSGLKPNAAFNGGTNPMILLPDSSTLAKGVADTVRFTVNVLHDGRETPYNNQVAGVAIGADSSQVAGDLSTAGLNPDANANGNPADDSEVTATLLPTLGDEIIIPEGFSPNGDGINDLFRIRNTKGAKIDMQVFNRWGSLVYGAPDYQNDWDGKANAGLVLGNQYLPEGTYYYVIKLSDGRVYKRFLTLMR